LLPTPISKDIGQSAASLCVFPHSETKLIEALIARIEAPYYGCYFQSKTSWLQSWGRRCIDVDYTLWAL